MRFDNDGRVWNLGNFHKNFRNFRRPLRYFGKFLVITMATLGYFFGNCGKYFQKKISGYFPTLSTVRSYWLIILYNGALNYYCGAPTRKLPITRCYYMDKFNRHLLPTCGCVVYRWINKCEDGENQEECVSTICEKCEDFCRSQGYSGAYSDCSVSTDADKTDQLYCSCLLKMENDHFFLTRSKSCSIFSYGISCHLLLVFILSLFH